jgi:hypothetical protein
MSRPKVCRLYVVEEIKQLILRLKLLVRAATPPLGTAGATSLAAEGLASLVLLAPQSAALRLFRLQLQITLGSNATTKIPNVATAPVAPFVAELAAAPVVQPALGAVTLGPTRKILIVSAFTEELESASGPDAASIVIAHILSAAAARSIDNAAFDANPDDGVRPAGLLNGIASLTPTTGGGLAAITADIAGMAGAITNAGVDPENFVLVASPPEAVKLRLLSGPQFDYEILGSTGMPAKSIAAFARGTIASSFEGMPVVETAKGATLHYDTVPGPVVASTPTRSLFQQGQIAVRLRQRGTWVRCAPGVALVSNVTW